MDSLDDLLVNPVRDAFAHDYEDARRRFMSAAKSWRSYPSAARGPQGQALHTDVAWIGPRDAREVLVVLSAVHGVEGYCGSGVQVDLARRPPALAPGQAIVLVHALNAYGFAWERRVTEEGCDLNRNFVDFDKAAPHNPGYLDLAEHLLPRSLEPEALEAAEAALTDLRQAMGEHAFQVARKSGQYVDPKGMFYGGSEASGPRRILEIIAQDCALEQRDFVTVIDLHTGLGPYGYGELQCENAPTDLSHHLAEAMFGPGLTSPALGTSYSVPVNGTVQLFWERLRGDGRYVYACLEFGTFDQEASRRAYRLDHWHHAYGDGLADSPGGVTARAAMRAQFYPEFDDWKAMVLFRSRQAVAQALAGMERFR
ncbi:DUF2817 domain-containing protein [Caulobacter segnis]|uniref:DUF2817 domain-containing protein n=1 Tax=Caulobacter segnis TaxID=88688 RepID=UPI00240F3F68|nr:DUF2817 domain-containing protein [Caulobacter segnis]MDG2521222.1 DUF2817 domain-containing protein [Caulobacter segnis]